METIFKNQTNKLLTKKTTSGSFVTSHNIQKKLAIGTSYDFYEQEADSVADKVLNTNDSSPGADMHSGPLVQRKCTECEEKKIRQKPLVSEITPVIQQKGNDSGTDTAPDFISQQINSSKGGGSPLDASTKNYMENRFGTDFSNVKIHTDQNAVKMSKELNAQAFTVGNDIYFNESKYNPKSSAGKHLLAHELTHTVQQGKGELNSIQMKGFGGYFKDCMDSMGMPSPTSLFTSITTATATIAAIEKAVATYGTSVTIGELIGAGVLSDALIVAAGVSAAAYVGACIGCLATASGQSLSGGYSLGDAAYDTLGPAPDWLLEYF